MTKPTKTKLQISENESIRIIADVDNLNSVVDALTEIREEAESYMRQLGGEQISVGEMLNKQVEIVFEAAVKYNCTEEDWCAILGAGCLAMGVILAHASLNRFREAKQERGT